MTPVMSPVPGGHDYDFDLSVGPDGARRWIEREVLEAFLARLPGVRRHEVRGFVLDQPPGRWMEIRPCAQGNRVDRIDLHFPARARGPGIDGDYVRTAFAIAEYLGWRVHDDTDSCDWVSRELLEAWWPARSPKPWWKFW